ncbi:MAG: cytochrome c biogenesis protein ResB [Anaeromyxobacteraceae bacterium]
MSTNDVKPTTAASRSGRAGPQAAIEFRHTTLLVTAALLVGVVLGAFIPPGPMNLVVATGISMVVVLVVAVFVGKRIRETMGAFRFTATLLVALAILAILGTLILQGKPPELYRARYGAVAPLILALRFDDIFHGLPFALLMALFCVAISFSAALRWPLRPKTIGFYLVHLGLLLSLGGAAVASTMAVRGRIDLMAGGDVATHVRATRGGIPTGETYPLGFQLKLDKFDLINYESEFRIGYYEQKMVKDEDGRLVEQWRLKTSFEPDTRRHLLPGGDTFQLEAIYPDFVRAAKAVPSQGGAPALEVTVAGRTTWLAPGDEPLLGPNGLVAVLFDADPPPAIEGVATSVLISANTKQVVVHRADGESVQPLTEGLALFGGLVKLGALLPSAERTLSPGTASQQWLNPAVQITVREGARRQEKLAFARQPQAVMLARGGALVFEKRQEEVKSYLSTVTVSSPGETKHAVISVNDPLRFEGWTLYQVNYNPKEPNYSGLEAVYDPGVAWVFTGFAVISLGVFFVFYVKKYLINDPRKKASQPQ